MKEKGNLPKYMIIYRCNKCNMESGFTERDEPACRHCNRRTELTLVSKQEITPEIMAERLKQLTDHMLKNLQSAFESMTDEDAAAFAADGKDAEKEMYELLAKTKALRDQIHNMELKEPVDGEEPK